MKDCCSKAQRSMFSIMPVIIGHSTPVRCKQFVNFILHILHPLGWSKTLQPLPAAGSSSAYASRFMTSAMAYAILYPEGPCMHSQSQASTLRNVLPQPDYTIDCNSTYYSREIVIMDRRHSMTAIGHIGCENKEFMQGIATHEPRNELIKNTKTMCTNAVSHRKATASCSIEKFWVCMLQPQFRSSSRQPYSTIATDWCSWS